MRENLLFAFRCTWMTIVSLNETECERTLKIVIYRKNLVHMRQVTKLQLCNIVVSLIFLWSCNFFCAVVREITATWLSYPNSCKHIWYLNMPTAFFPLLIRPRSLAVYSQNRRLPNVLHATGKEYYLLLHSSWCFGQEIMLKVSRSSNEGT